jgi:hypothetical protein
MGQTFLRADGGLNPPLDDREMQLGLQKITKLGHPLKTIGHEGDADEAAPLTVAGDFGHEGLRVAVFVIPPVFHLLPLIGPEDHRHPVAETLQLGR